MVLDISYKRNGKLWKAITFLSIRYAFGLEALSCGVLLSLCGVVLSLYGQLLSSCGGV